MPETVFFIDGIAQLGLQTNIMGIITLQVSLECVQKTAEGHGLRCLLKKDMYSFVSLISHQSGIVCAFHKLLLT